MNLSRFLHLQTALICALIVLVTSCQKDPDDPWQDTGVYCTVQSAIDALSDVSADQVLLTDTLRMEGYYLLTFEDGQQVKICEAIVSALDLNADFWKATLTFAGNIATVVPYLGNANGLEVLNIDLNPRGVVPLGAEAYIITAVPGAIEMRVIGKNGPSTDVIHWFETVDTVHTIPIYGLYAGYENRVEFTLTDAAGEPRVTTEVQITTGEITVPMPEIVVRQAIVSDMEAGFTMINEITNRPASPFIIDHFGDVRWYADFNGSLPLSNLRYGNGPKRLRNGNLFFADKETGDMVEMTFMGEVVRTCQLTGYAFHHDLEEKPDGNLVLTVSSENSLHENGSACIEDFAMEFDPKTCSIVKVWDLKDALDEHRVTLGEYDDGTFSDWFHGNSITYDESDHTIVVSGRHQGVAKIGYDDNLVWVIGNHKGWGANRQGQAVEDRLLTPLNANGQAIEDTAVLYGYTNHPDFEWCWNQHAAMVMPDGNILLFDNGDMRNYSAEQKYSRAVEYQIDGGLGTIRQVWQYGKERGLETYSRVVSDVDYLPGKDNILFSPGARVINSTGNGGKVVEVDRRTGQVVFEVEITNGSNIGFHQAERLHFY